MWSHRLLTRSLLFSLSIVLAVCIMLGSGKASHLRLSLPIRIPVLTDIATTPRMPINCSMKFPSKVPPWAPTPPYAWSCVVDNLSTLLFQLILSLQLLNFSKSGIAISVSKLTDLRCTRSKYLIYTYIYVCIFIFSRVAC